MLGALSGELSEGEGGIASLVLRVQVVSELGGVSLHSVLNSSDAHDSRVDSARDAVGKLHVDLGNLEVIKVVGVAFLDISL